MRIVDLDAKPTYEALSYVWGDSGLTKAITVSGKRVLVTVSLFAALRRFRYVDSMRTMWIDQLSINQWDIKEKAAQVALMRDIYRLCEHCVLWLGEIPSEVERTDAEEALDFIREVAQAKICAPGQHPKNESMKHDNVFDGDETPTIFQANEKGKAVRKAFTSFAMYGNPWWSRVWTIQESILPSRATLYWGDLTISRQAVSNFARRMKRGPLGCLNCFPPWFQEHRNNNDELVRCLIYPVHGILYSQAGEATLNIFMRWRHRQATDPRDKVYALLGLFSPESIPSAQDCSYSVPAHELFAKVTVDLIHGEKGLRPFLGSSEIAHQTARLPSWAIDFACSNRVGKRQLKWWGHSHRYEQFSACGGRDLEFEVSERKDAIRLMGVYIDRVAKVGGVYSVTDDQPLLASQLWTAIFKSRSLLETFLTEKASQTSEYPRGGSFASAFWRTMIGDLIMDEYPIERAQPCHEADFKETYTRLGPQSFEFQPAHVEPQRGTVPGYDTPSITLESLCGMIPNHAFFITEKGYLGIGPPATASGDEVWVLYGGNVPFVMRAMREKQDKDLEQDPSNAEITVAGVNDRKELCLVGDAYVHGIMDGQAVSDGHVAVPVWLR